MKKYECPFLIQGPTPPCGGAQAGLILGAWSASASPPFCFITSSGPIGFISDY